MPSFNDPLFASEWYLVNTGQRGGTSRLDINVLSAWDTYTGKGVVIAVNDDGMDLTHPALASNLLTTLTYDGVRGTVGQGFVDASSSHGTVVGSIVGMAGNDGVGGVGVAYEAKIVPGLAVAAGVNTANVFLANLAAGAGVSVNSWGQDPAFAENFGASGSPEDAAWAAALARAAGEARNGLGMVIEVSGGNERGNKADTALSNFTGSKLTIAVGAVTETGAPTDYSTPGASLLVSAPGGVGGDVNSDNSGFGILSADLQGSAGYNTTTGVAGDYTYQNQGTSYSGPMVGGAAALMLQANPNLGFRDVSTILALTARKVDVANASWVQTNTTDWNLGSMHFSRDFGYGLLDVSAAVRLAESWTASAGTLANWVSAQGVSATASAAIADNSPAGLTVTASVSDNVRVERMEFDLNLSAASPSQLSATITSPGGTVVTLFDQPLTRNLVSGAPDMTSPETAWPDTFTIGSTAFLGETSAGTWTLKLVDKVTGVTATYNSLTVRAWGSTITADSQYVLTDEFGGLATNPTLTDTGGIDTINAAAVSQAVRLDLVGGNKSSGGTGDFTIASGSTIENAIGGLANDTLIGNAVANYLRGNGGNDTMGGGAGNDAIDGGPGIDTALYTGSRAGFTLTKTANGFNLVDALGLDGTDALSNVERLKFSDGRIGLDVGATQSAGATALLMGAVLPGRLVFDVSKQALLGAVIDLFDQGYSLQTLSGAVMRLPIWDVLTGKTTPNNTDIATYMLTNVNGVAPDATTLASAVTSLSTETDFASQGNFLWRLAESSANQTHVGLVGLASTGLAYTV
jgi:subtilisin-like proprotein convertase family protein